MLWHLYFHLVGASSSHEEATLYQGHDNFSVTSRAYFGNIMTAKALKTSQYDVKAPSGVQKWPILVFLANEAPNA